MLIEKIIYTCKLLTHAPKSELEHGMKLLMGRHDPEVSGEADSLAPFYFSLAQNRQLIASDWMS